MWWNWTLFDVMRGSIDVWSSGLEWLEHHGPPGGVWSAPLDPPCAVKHHPFLQSELDYSVYIFLQQQPCMTAFVFSTRSCALLLMRFSQNNPRTARYPSGTNFLDPKGPLPPTPIIFSKLRCWPLNFPSYVSTFEPANGLVCLGCFSKIDVEQWRRTVASRNRLFFGFLHWL